MRKKENTNTAKHSSTDFGLHNKEHGHKCIPPKHIGVGLTKKLSNTLLWKKFII